MPGKGTGAVRESSTRERILKTAERVFSDRSYEGARIDEIAVKARVSKSLIYYYFRSKSALLDELFRSFIDEARAILTRFIRQGGFARNAEQNAREFADAYADLFAERRETLKIMLIESVKNSNRRPPLFDLVRVSGIEAELSPEDIGDSGVLKGRSVAEMQVQQFFTSILPLIGYVVFREKWCRSFAVSAKELEQWFDHAMDITHGRIHR
jgi:AcrR family transcriptional regulator